MELHEVMRTTFAARDFTDEPVSDAQIGRILDDARFAPSGGNRQGWKVIVVRQAATRKRLLEWIEPTFKRYWTQVQAGEAPFNPVNPSRVTEAEIAASDPPMTFVRKMAQAPVVLLVFVDLREVAAFDARQDRVSVIAGASIYPFVWNILLAARNEGLGGTLTTFVGAKGKELQAFLGVPEQMAFAAMLPLGRPVKQLTKLRRKPVRAFAALERWGGAPLEF